MDWSEGYVTDIGYTRGYYRELSAAQQAFVLSATGHEPIDLQAPFVKVELGCGYGVSLLMEAAVYPHAKFYGVDFNPDHITWAKRIAALAGLENIQFLETSFADLLTSPIPEADFVGLHGVWSWISEENREAIQRYLDRRLKSGGVVMVSYNALPGWTANRALRELMMRKFRSTIGPTSDRIQQALNFAVEMRGLGALIFKQYPSLSESLDSLLKLSKHYLAHEYFNQDWHLFYHHEVAQALAESRLAFLCSGKPIENFDNLNFPQSALTVIEQVAAGERETLKDLFLNRMFRFDLYGRGVEKIGVLGSTDHLLNSGYILIDNPAKLAEGRVKTILGSIKLKRELFGPILDRLAVGSAAGRDFVVRVGAKPMRPAEIAETLTLLMEVNMISPVMPEEKLDLRTTRTRRLNDALFTRTRKGEEIGFQISPITGLGHTVQSYYQFFAAAEKERADPILYAWNVLKNMNRRMQRDGVVCEGEEANLAELRRRFQEYHDDVKPRLATLRIVDAA